MDIPGQAVTKDRFPREPLPETVSVVLLQPLRSPAGTVWAAKERAGFPPDVARDLIRRGVAREDTKAPAEPEKDKMLKGTQTQRK